MTKLTEGNIAKTLWKKHGLGQWAAANIYYYAFESDLLILRKSGYVVEYEIKLSVQDWNNGLAKRTCLDADDKNVRRGSVHRNATEMISRHEYLTQELGANMFYYVAPKEVLERVEIPEWAGVISVREHGRPDTGILRSIEKQARFLHKKKAPEKLKKKIMTSCYYKYWQHFAVRDINEVLMRTR